jgi:hypothetical protein
MYIYPLSRRQYVYGMLIARTSNEFTKINEQEENSRCNARGYMRKGKGRPDITEVMFYPGYMYVHECRLFICSTQDSKYEYTI